jgi:drug/metabolite transporter (DMT)-like permease
MFDVDENADRNGLRILWMSLCGLGIIMILGAITGFLSAHMSEGGGPLNIASYAVLAALMSVALLLAFVIWKLFRQMKRSDQKVPRREKVYNRFMVGSFIFGGVTGLLLALTGSFDANETGLISNDTMSPTLAIILSIAIGVIAPASTFYMHKHAVDEQEEAAYRFAALIAIYAFWFIAPVWWLLWRGGMLPEVNGITLYFMTFFAATAVWFWKKYL